MQTPTPRPSTVWISQQVDKENRRYISRIERRGLGQHVEAIVQQSLHSGTQAGGLLGRQRHAEVVGIFLQAIGRLRQAIARLNREGRERIETAFKAIDGHFGTLFKRLFGGGRAHLSLVGSDDPLEAGLEVMASPPGKRLQALSLLSGGEQALAALALLFAVFLTNPAPICVLDEVDAPLDDSNVGRFCDLVDDIARGSATRFLIITHHHITMARMDRLYGAARSTSWPRKNFARDS